MLEPPTMTLEALTMMLAFVAMMLALSTMGLKYSIESLYEATTVRAGYQRRFL